MDNASILSSTVEVRLAQLADLPTIENLILESIPMGISVLRDLPNAIVVDRARTACQTLEAILSHPDVSVLVAAVNSKVIGYLILENNYIEETTGEQQSYIRDLGVCQNWWGLRVGHKLVSEAIRITYRSGHKYLACRVTASNRRSLLSCRHFGFEVERYQLVIACGPDGAEPMPGRPEEERSHDLNRIVRRKRRLTHGKFV